VSNFNEIATIPKTISIDLEIRDFFRSGIIGQREQSIFIRYLIKNSKEFKKWRKNKNKN
jgi:hypothetical protein